MSLEDLVALGETGEIEAVEELLGNVREGPVLEPYPEESY